MQHHLGRAVDQDGVVGAARPTLPSRGPREVNVTMPRHQSARPDDDEGEEPIRSISSTLPRFDPHSISAEVSDHRIVCRPAASF